MIISIFNITLDFSVAPTHLTCWTIITEKNTKLRSLFITILALTSVLMKSFKGLIRNYIWSFLSSLTQSQWCPISLHRKEYGPILSVYTLLSVFGTTTYFGTDFATLQVPTGYYAYRPGSWEVWRVVKWGGLVVSGMIPSPWRLCVKLSLSKKLIPEMHFKRLSVLMSKWLISV